MKAMISQPMAGKSKKEIIETRRQAIHVLYDLGYDVVNTLFTDERYDERQMKERGIVNTHLYFLAKSLEKMSECDVVYFTKGWAAAQGCRVERDVAKAYGLMIIYEE